MKLVTFQSPIFSTLQGEGSLVGMPSVFVRLHGCDYSCEWCDTKKSWEPGSASIDMPLEQVIERVKSFNLLHLVITGGNPLLQVNDVADLASSVRQTWWDRDKRMWRPGMHVTVETQGSVFDQTALYHVDLLSLSPKVHVQGWQALVWPWLDSAHSLPLEVQLKLVITSREDFKAAVEFFEHVRYRWEREQSIKPLPTMILQPESSAGRRLAENVRTWYEEYMRNVVRCPIPVRIIPQLHKTTLHVI